MVKNALRKVEIAQPFKFIMRGSLESTLYEHSCARYAINVTLAVDIE